VFFSLFFSLIYCEPCTIFPNNPKFTTQIENIKKHAGEISAKLYGVLTAKNFQPILIKGPMNILIQGIEFFIQDSKGVSAIMSGEVTQNGKSYKIAFDTLIDSCSGKIDVEILYLGNGALLTRQLFHDVLPSTLGILLGGKKKPTDSFIFMDEKQVDDSGNRATDWVIYAQGEELNRILMETRPDGKGGTNWTCTPYPKQ
jgi:hypothetical protein